MSSQKNYDTLYGTDKQQAGWATFYTYLTPQQQKLVDLIYEGGRTSSPEVALQELNELRDNLEIIQEDLNFATQRINDLYRSLK